jgi:hypothetical protein
LVSAKSLTINHQTQGTKLFKAGWWLTATLMQPVSAGLVGSARRFKACPVFKRLTINHQAQGTKPAQAG